MLLAGIMVLDPIHAFAADGSASAAGESGGAADKPAWAGDLETRSNLFGDTAGLRPLLDRSGISFGLSETTEVLGNPVGGVKRGAIAEGLTQMSIGADLSKAFGLEGAIVNVSAFQFHGRGLSTNNVPALDVISSIEADPSTRLNEVWLQQSVFGGTLDVKIGQQSADLEFITSEYEDLFINSGFGWPTLPAQDLPSGGLAFPPATPGIRVRATPTEAITALAGVFNDTPVGLGRRNPRVNDQSGTSFDVSSGALIIGEMQYSLNKGEDQNALPGTYKLGAWYDTNRFADAFQTEGAWAQPPGVLDGISRTVRGDWSVYGTLDQLVYRPGADGDQGLALTARAMGAPGDRNLIDLFMQAGVIYKGAFDRMADTMGVGIEWAHVGDRARAGDLAASLTAGAPEPKRTSEIVVEATYQAEIAPWWQLQPDVQYVIRPGAGLADPDRPGKAIGNAAVFGLRSVVTF